MTIGKGRNIREEENASTTMKGGMNDRVAGTWNETRKK